DAGEDVAELRGAAGDAAEEGVVDGQELPLPALLRGYGDEAREAGADEARDGDAAVERPVDPGRLGRCGGRGLGVGRAGGEAEGDGQAQDPRDVDPSHAAREYPIAARVRARETSRRASRAPTCAGGVRAPTAGPRGLRP